MKQTKDKIHAAAMRHFLKEGFQRASLRKIVSEAGFTLGAFYGYYRSKEELFGALVEETAEGIVSIISGMGDEIDQLPPEEKMTTMTAVFTRGLPALLDYVMDHEKETRLLLTCADGTRYEHFLDGLMERDLDLMKGISGDAFPLHPLAAKLLVNSYFSVLGEAALSGEPREEIARAMKEIVDLYAGGMIFLTKGSKNT